MWKSITTGLAIGSLTFGLGTATAQDVREEQFEGTVVSVDPAADTMRVRQEDSNEVRMITLDDESEIYFEGRRAGLVEGALNDISPGDEVFVELEYVGDTERVRSFSRDRNEVAQRSDAGSDLDAGAADDLDADEPDNRELLAQNPSEERRLPSTATPAWIYGAFAGLMMLAGAALVHAGRVRRARIRR